MGFLNKIFGDKVKVPKFKEIDPDVQIEKAFKSMQEHLPEGERIATSIAEADAGTTLALLERFAPGTGEVIQQQVSNLQAGLRGELPADVLQRSIDRSASKAFDGGFAGSGASRKLVARDVAQTTLQRMDTAMNQATNTLSYLRGMLPAQQSVGSMFLSGKDRYNIAVSERNMEYQRDLEAAQVAAQPDPVTKGIALVAAKVVGSALGAGLPGGSAAAVGAGDGGIGGGGIISRRNASAIMGGPKPRSFRSKLGTNLANVLMG